MNENKKGTGIKPAPNTTNYSIRTVDLCLLLSIISMFALLISELYHCDTMAAFSMGAMIATGIPVTHHNLKRR